VADGPEYPPPQPIQRPAPSAAPPPSNVYGPSGTPSTAPSIAVGSPAGKRRWWMVVVGVLVILSSLGPLLVGAVLLLAEGVVNIADAEAEGTMPEADLSFDADDAQYDIFLSGRGVTEGDGSSVSCQITLADGEQVEVDGTVQGVAIEGATSSVGSFDAVEGATEVRCTGGDSGERIYLGRDRPALERGGWIGIGLGVVGVLAGMGLLMLGLFWRKPPRHPGVTYVPSSTPPGPTGPTAGPVAST
jgi:hypothetical protein